MARPLKDRWRDNTCNFCPDAALRAESIMAFRGRQPGDTSYVLRPRAFRVGNGGDCVKGFAACPSCWTKYADHTYDQLDELAIVTEVARALEA